MSTPLRAIDLKLKMRNALYRRFSVKQLRAMLTKHPDITNTLFELAWEVAPTIFPQVENETIAQLLALASDLPELLTQEEPEAFAAIRFDYEIFPRTPLLLLHANVVCLAMHYGQQDMVQLPQLLGLEEDSRLLYNAMQRKYVLSGHDSSGSLGMREVFEAFGLHHDWNKEQPFRDLLTELIDAGLGERRQCKAEAYQLTVGERCALIEEFHLAERWPAPNSPYDEVIWVRQALATLSSSAETDSYPAWYSKTSGKGGQEGTR